MKTLPLLFLTLLFAFGISSCKKDSTTPASVKEILVSKTWKSSALTADGVAEPKWCWLNSLYDFTESGNLYYTQGDDLGACNGTSIGEITSFKYMVTSDEKYIILLEPTPNETDTFEIISITDQTLKTKRVVNKSTTPSTWEDTFLAQ